MLKIGQSATEGNYIIIQHEDGYTSHYLHIKNQGIYVEEGEEVYDGDIIGEIGSTGRSMGNHLHFGIKKDGLWIDLTLINDL